MKNPFMADFDKSFNKRYSKYGLQSDVAGTGKIFRVIEQANKPLYVLRWKPQAGKQELAWERIKDEKINIVGYGGTRGSGKSELAINGNLELMYELGLGYDGVYLRNKASELEDIVSRMQQALWRDYEGNGKPFEYNGQKRILTLKNGAKIQFFYVEKNGLDSMQGGNKSHFTFEEPQLMKNMANQVLPKVKGLWRSATGVAKKQLWLFNPLGASTAFLKTYFVDNGHNVVVRNEGSGKVFIRASLADNPILLANDPSYKKQLEGLPEHMRKAWLEGDFEVRAGVAFPFLTKGHNGFNDTMFRPADYPWYLSMDWGFTSPSCVGFYCVYKDNIVIRFDELKFSQKTVDEAAYLIKEKMNHYRNDTFQFAVADTAIFAETEGKSIAVRMGETQGLWFRRAYKERQTGFLKVYRFLQKQKLLVNVNCDYFWSSVPNLILNENKESDIEQSPKQEDHCYDEVRYMLMAMLTE